MCLVNLRSLGLKTQCEMEKQSPWPAPVQAASPPPSCAGSKEGRRWKVRDAPHTNSWFCGLFVILCKPRRENCTLDSRVIVRFEHGCRKECKDVFFFFFYVVVLVVMAAICKCEINVKIGAHVPQFIVVFVWVCVTSCCVNRSLLYCWVSLYVS